MMGRGRVRAVTVAALLAASVAGAEAQRTTPYRVNTAVVPQAITVGDVFHAAVRIDLPRGAAVSFPDSLAPPADVETAGRREVRIDTTDTGLAVTAIYPLAGWRPGDVALPPVAVVVRDPGSDRQSGATRADTVVAEFPAFAIASVLPADTSGIEPKPAKDVLGANRVWWPFLVAAAVVLAVLAALWLWYRRRRPQIAVVEVPAVPPRDRALEALDAARASGLAEQGRHKEFYTLVTDALRGYVEALDGRWGRELTTSELAGRMRREGIDADAAALVALLGNADLVKFAQRRPQPVEAFADWSAARRFVESFDWPPPPVVPAEEARAA